MASGSIVGAGRLKGTFKGLGRSASRTGYIQTAAQRRRVRANVARRNAREIRSRLNSF